MCLNYPKVESCNSIEKGLVGSKPRAMFGLMVVVALAAMDASSL